MAAYEVQRLALNALDAVLSQAKVEGWTELALLSGNDLEYVIADLVRVGWPKTQLFVLSEPLYNLPEVMFEIDSLSSLDLGGNRIGTTGAVALTRLYSLTSLNLWNNRISDSGAAEIAKIKCLTSLNLAGNNIGDDGASELVKLSAITLFDLWNNKIGDHGATALSQLNALTSLNLWKNNIGDSGATSLARLSGLTSLVLADNNIGDTGATALAKLSGLTSLNLWNNNIGDAGAIGLAQLHSMRSLDLAENQIGDAGATALAQMSGLTSLVLRGNRVGGAGGRAVLNAWTDAATTDRRKMLDLRRNSDLGGLLPAEVLEQTDAQALIAAWRRFREAEAKGELRPLNEAKVLVLGNEAVGKTSLVRYLVDGLPRDESEQKTAGIVIRRDVSIGDWSAEGSAVRLHFWDFGGQEIMHQTHRYFLTRRSLYLIVLEDRREDDRSVYDWLKVIRSRGGESPVLVVINKCDAGAARLRLDETGIRAAYPNVVGFVAVSCNEGSEARIAGLRQEIAGLVVRDPRLKHVRDPFPPEQLRVKRAVAAAAEEARYLERAAFIQLCEAGDEPALRITNPALQRSLLQLLHDLGTVVAHGLERERSDAARAVTLLDPNWLTEAIYRLLNSKQILDQGGTFSRDDMAAELDSERYPPERHGYIVDMMQEPEIGLCFRLPGRGERWLIPECLPTFGPDVEGFFAGALRFRFRYEFLPIGLVPRFIVEAYNKFTEQPTRWRTGALLAAAGCKVLVKADLDKSRIDLAVTGPEARRRSALEAVLHDLEAVHKLNPEIGTEARVPLPDDPEVDVGYADLLKWEDAEGTDYSFWPEKAKRKYTVGELLAGVRVDGGRRVMLEAAPVVPPPARGLAGHPYFPIACGVVAMAVFVVAWLLPSNEWRAFFLGAVGVGVFAALLATHFAPGRFYGRLLSWFLWGGVVVHAAGFSAGAGWLGEAAANVNFDSRVGVGFSIAWMIIAVGLVVADLRQTPR
jgi:internalin A